MLNVLSNPIIVNTIIYIIIFVTVGIFLKIRPNYRKNVMYILNNIITLYKNYIHWSISKIIIYIYGWVYAIVIGLPFLGISVFLLYKTSGILNPEWISTFLIDNKVDYGAVVALLQHPFLMVSLIIVFIILFAIFTFSFMFAYLLQQNVYKNYLEGKKIPYKTNFYFNWKLMIKYLGIICWVILYMFIPIGITLLYLGLLLLLGRFDAIKPFIYGENIAGGIFQMIVFASLFIYFIYLGLRLSFAYICILYSEDFWSNSAYSFVVESLAITKGKVWKIVGIGIPFLAISILLDNVFTLIEGVHPYAPLILSVVNFFIFSGMSLMIYLSIYRILVGKMEFAEVIGNNYQKPMIDSLNSEVAKKGKVTKKMPAKKTGSTTTPPPTPPY